MSKHTAGPWKFNGGYITTMHGDILAKPYDWDGNKNPVLANAAVMTAAPELLAELEAALRLMPLGTKIRADWMRRAGEAVARARSS